MMLMHRALRGGNPVASDVTAPTLSSAVGTTLSATTATVGATTNEANGTLYVVVTTSATQPSIAQIKAGNDHTGAAAVYDSSQSITTTGAKTFNATGLTAETGYYAHLVHTDAAANDSNRLSSSLFTTEAASGSVTQIYLEDFAGGTEHSTSAFTWIGHSANNGNSIGVVSDGAGGYCRRYRVVAQGMCETRWCFGPSNSSPDRYDDIWVRRRITIPANCQRTAGSNNKFWALWQAQETVGDNSDYGGPSGVSTTINCWTEGNYHSGGWTDSAGDTPCLVPTTMYIFGPSFDTHAFGEPWGAYRKPWIEDADLGETVEYIVHFKNATVADNDGAMAAWKIRGATVVPLQIYDDAATYRSGQQGFSHGYEFGAQDHAFDANPTAVDFLVHEFEAVTGDEADVMTYFGIT